MTTANLARRADISEGTIYRHFESKEDILQHILDTFDQKYQTLAEQCRGRMEKDTLTLDDLLGSHFAFLEANAADIKIVLGTYSILELTKRSMGRFNERICAASSRLSGPRHQERNHSRRSLGPHRHDHRQHVLRAHEHQAILA
jgi:AcrR family transcriptional regulator